MEDAATKIGEGKVLDGQQAVIEFVDGVDIQTGVSLAEYRKLFDVQVVRETFDILEGVRIYGGDKRLANILERQAIFSWSAKNQVMGKVPGKIIEVGYENCKYVGNFSRAEIAYALVTLLTDCCFAELYDPAVILVQAIRKFDGDFAKELIRALSGNNLWSRKIGDDWVNNVDERVVGEAWAGGVIKIAEAKVVEHEIMQRADETKKGIRAAAKV